MPSNDKEKTECWEMTISPWKYDDIPRFCLGGDSAPDSIWTPTSYEQQQQQHQNQPQKQQQ